MDKMSMVSVRVMCMAVMIFAGTWPTAAQPLVKPLKRAHAHNDYLHERPLLDALDQGFCSVEADIYLIEGELRVAHDRKDARPGRTLEALYLDPLLERVRKNAGHVHPGMKTGADPEFTLLIDIKSNGEAAYARLREVFKKYSEMLTVFHADRMESKAVTVIISGDRPRKALMDETPRFAGMDGRVADLIGEATRFQIPLMSDNWLTQFKWRGSGGEPIPEAEAQKLKEIIEKAHTQGRRVRFWGAPDTPIFWKTLYDAGADLINTDHLKELRDFLEKESPGGP